MPETSNVDYSTKIPNNVGLMDDQRVLKALEQEPSRRYASAKTRRRTTTSVQAGKPRGAASAKSSVSRKPTASASKKPTVSKKATTAKKPTVARRPTTSKKSTAKR